MKNKLKITTIFSLTLLCLAITQAACLGAPTDQISQFGINWVFDGQYEHGQFANGDYWVLGPVSIINIDPMSVDIGGRIVNGSMINPSPSSGLIQGYDSGMYGSEQIPGDYDPFLNAARPGDIAISVTNPLIVNPGSSLVSTISTPDTFDETQLQTAAVLTVLNSIPPEGSFRPPYSGSDKTIKFNRSQLNYSLLNNLTPATAGFVPRLTQGQYDGQSDSVERMFERPWLNHIPTWRSQYHHPVDNMPHYYRDIANQIGIAALMLHLDRADQEKETLLTRFVQLGIDNYGVIQDGGEENFGEIAGCKWSIIFAGLILDNTDMKNIGQRSGDYIDIGPYGPGNLPPDYIHFREDDQTFYVDQNATGGYDAGDIGLPEWGISHATDPGEDLKDWNGIGSRRTASAIAWTGFILAAHIMDARDLWNHDALFDYQDRYMEVEDDWRWISLFVEDMWDTHRTAFKPVWTRNDPADIYSQGYYIEDDIMLGDVTGNGNVSSYDASLTAQYAIGLISLSADEVLRADVTQNDDVSAYDASLIAQYAIGLIDGF